MKLLSTAEAATRLGITPRRVLVYIEEKRLRAQKVGRGWVIREGDLVRLERLPEGWRKGRARKPHS